MIKITMVIVSLLFASFSASALKINACDTQICADYFSSFKKAAQRGHPQAMYILGKFYQNGYGTAVNLAKSLTYYQKAALRGIFEARFKTGYLLLTNENTYNYDKGVKWLTSAANSGHQNAAFLLGLTYYNEEKFSDADKWLTLAYQKKQVDIAAWMSLKNQESNFNDKNLPLLLSATSTDFLALSSDGSNSNDKIERITISAPSLQNIFDSMLVNFKSKVKSTGTRLPAIRCIDNVACQQKSLNEMKDSIWVD